MGGRGGRAGVSSCLNEDTIRTKINGKSKKTAATTVRELSTGHLKKGSVEGTSVLTFL